MMSAMDRFGIMAGSLLTMFSNEIGGYISDYAGDYKMFAYIATTGLCLAVSIPTIAHCYNNDIGRE